jgi:hypothetical protein
MNPGRELLCSPCAFPGDINPRSRSGRRAVVSRSFWLRWLHGVGRLVAEGQAVASRGVNPPSAGGRVLGRGRVASSLARDMPMNFHGGECHRS